MFLSASPAACNVLSYTGPNASPEHSLNETDYFNCHSPCLEDLIVVYLNMSLICIKCGGLVYVCVESCLVICSVMKVFCFLC